MSQKWVVSFINVIRRFTGPVGLFLLMLQLVVIGLDVVSNSVDLPYQAYVGLFVFSLILYLLIDNWLKRAKRSSVATATVSNGGSTSRQRVGVDMQGGRAWFRNTSIANQDVSFRAIDSDIDADDLDIR